MIIVPPSIDHLVWFVYIWNRKGKEVLRRLDNYQSIPSVDRDWLNAGLPKSPGASLSMEEWFHMDKISALRDGVSIADVVTIKAIPTRDDSCQFWLDEKRGCLLLLLRIEILSFSHLTCIADALVESRSYQTFPRPMRFLIV